MTAAPTDRPDPPPHRRLHEFAKSALITIFVFPYAAVCDLFCGPADDVEKFDEAQIGTYIGIDEVGSGIDEAREEWEGERKAYAAEFYELDPSSEELEAQLVRNGVEVDLVCCFQHLQVCFESEERAKRLLQNVSTMLKPGGYFVGTTVDSSMIWTKYLKCVEASHNKGLRPSPVPNCIKSENYLITFEVDEEKFPFFGKKYQIKFSNDLSFETHYLVHFGSLIRLARESGLDYIEIQNLTEFYDDNRAQLSGLLSSFGANFLDPRGKLVSRSYDVLGLYSMFVFQKPDPDVTAPISSPMSVEESPVTEEQHSLHGGMDEERNGQIDSSYGPMEVHSESDKGILGPGPADLRFAEAPF